MIPLFKSHFSFGNSILTLDKIFELGQGLKEIPIVEDNMSSLRKIQKLKVEKGVPFRFGLRISASENSDPSKIIFFAKNDEGIKKLRDIYTESFTKNNGVFEIGSVPFNSNEILKVIPFYDSFLHKNIHSFGNHSFSESFLKDCVFLEESNNHPFDYQISKAIKKNTNKTVNAKSIYYEKKEHFLVFQFYKSACNRKVGRKQPTFDAPELPHMSSDLFCWESFLENYGER